MAEPDEIAALLRETAGAHHDAFAEVDGADPEWPLWYAERLAPRLGELLDTDLTVSELVHSLLLAEEAHQGDGDWTGPYVEVLLRRHGAAGT